MFWVATGVGAVWAIRGDELLRIDPRTSEVMSRLRVPPAAGLAAGAGAAWIVTQDQRLLRISADGRQLTGTLPLSGNGAAPVAGPSEIWLIVYVGNGEVWRVDPRSMSQEAASRTGSTPLDLALDDGAVYTVQFDGGVSRIDPDTGHVISTTVTAKGASRLAVGDGAVWTSVGSR